MLQHGSGFATEPDINAIGVCLVRVYTHVALYAVILCCARRQRTCPINVPLEDFLYVIKPQTTSYAPNLDYAWIPLANFDGQPPINYLHFSSAPSQSIQSVPTFTTDVLELLGQKFTYGALC